MSANTVFFPPAWFTGWFAGWSPEGLPPTGEFPSLRAQAESYGIWTPTVEDSAAYVLQNAMEALRVGLFGVDGTSGILSIANRGVAHEFASEVNKKAYIALWTAVSSAAADMYAAIDDAIAVERSAEAAATAEANAIAAIPARAPKYIGLGILSSINVAEFAAYTISRPTFKGGQIQTNATLTSVGNVVPHIGDWLLNYSGSVEPYGVYIWTGTIWSQANITPLQRSSAMEDVYSLNCLASPLVLSDGTFFAEAQIYFLASKFIRLITGGALFSGGYNEYGDKVTDEPGLFLSANGQFLGRSASLENLNILNGKVLTDFVSQWAYGTFGSWLPILEIQLNTSGNIPSVKFIALSENKAMMLYTREGALRAKIRSASGVWGDEEYVAVDGADLVCGAEMPDGRVFILAFQSEYGASPTGALYEIIRSRSGQWSEPRLTGLSINIANNNSIFIPFSDGSSLYFDYGAKNEYVRNVNGEWSGPTAVLGGIGKAAKVCRLSDDSVLLVYRTTTAPIDFLYAIRSPAGVWGTPVPFGTDVYVTALLNIGGTKAVLFYGDTLDDYYRIWDGSSFGSAISDTHTEPSPYNESERILLTDGRILFFMQWFHEVYGVGNARNVQEVEISSKFELDNCGSTLTDLGAGIIESGKVNDIFYDKWSNGRLECYGYVTNVPDEGYVQITLPIAFRNTAEMFPWATRRGSVGEYGVYSIYVDVVDTTTIRIVNDSHGSNSLAANVYWGIKGRSA